MYKVVQVRFTTSGKEYSYFTDIEDIEVGDSVVVYARGELKLVTVSKTQGLSRSSINKASALIVQVVDLVKWDEGVKKLSLIMEVKNELRAAKEQHDEMEVYQIMAKANPRVAGLLEKLSKLDASMVPQIN